MSDPFFRRPEVLLALTSVVLVSLLSEGAFRAIGHDFSGRLAAHEAQPIYYRQPTVEDGSVFFRREGPARWRGNVLRQGFFAAWPDAPDDPYRDAPEIDATYDAEGFRNPRDLEDWAIAVAGDSFTELGYLPHEALFTTRLGVTLGRPVRNLGVSYTGTLSHVHYLRKYGRSKSVRDFVIIFFEGNDLTESAAELRALEATKAGKARPVREIELQTSLFGHLYERFFSPEPDPLEPTPRTFASHKRRAARFQSDLGPIPVTFAYAPSAQKDVSAEQRAALEFALTEYSRLARDAGVRPWLLYLPAKRRVLHGRLRFGPDADAWRWQPSTLPLFIAGIASSHGIGFADATPALVQETRRGRLTYNGIWDTHLNDHRSRVVADVLAEALTMPVELR